MPVTKVYKLEQRSMFNACFSCVPNTDKFTKGLNETLDYLFVFDVCNQDIRQASSAKKKGHCVFTVKSLPSWFHLQPQRDHLYRMTADITIEYVIGALVYDLTLPAFGTLRRYNVSFLLELSLHFWCHLSPLMC